MSKSLDPTHPSVPQNHSGEFPKVTLLNSEQWLFVQGQYNLTSRERQIAELVCQGLANSSIASRLKVSPGTVKTHLRNIYRKMKIRSKIAMLLTFVEESRQHTLHWDEDEELF
jgi:DNA-binding NarL/FixJ family response regulator